MIESYLKKINHDEPRIPINVHSSTIAYETSTTTTTDRKTNTSNEPASSSLVDISFVGSLETLLSSKQNDIDHITIECSDVIN
jgi:hypothetical protein